MNVMSDTIARPVKNRVQNETIDPQQKLARVQSLLEASRRVHSTIRLDDVLGEVLEIAAKELEAEGVKIPRPPGPMKHGTTVIAFIEDPDGYKVELIERS